MIFVCANPRCCAVDNTSLAPGYHAARDGRRLCTACETGAWHGEFPRRQYDAAADGPIGRGQVIHPERVWAA